MDSDNRSQIIALNRFFKKNKTKKKDRRYRKKKGEHVFHHSDKNQYGNGNQLAAYWIG